MELLEDLKTSLSNFNFVMIYIIHKMLLLKNHLNYLKYSIFECIFKEHDRLSLFFKKIFFSQRIMMESLSLEEEKIIRDIRNFFRLKKVILELKM